MMNGDAAVVFISNILWYIISLKMSSLHSYFTQLLYTITET